MSDSTKWQPVQKQLALFFVEK